MPVKRAAGLSLAHRKMAAVAGVLFQMSEVFESAKRFRPVHRHRQNSTQALSAA
jgi:hypothetical protein